MFDYKPVLQKLAGQPIPESVIKGKPFAQITEKQPKLLGTPYRFRRYGESGTEVSELLPYTASIVDDLAVIKTVKTTEFAHHLAELMLYTGTPRFGRPGLGAWVTYGLGSEAENLPGFVVLPGVGALGGMARTKEAVFSNGFLPSAYQGVPLRPVGEPILNVTDPPGVTRPQEGRLVQLINDLNQERLTETGDPEIAARISSYEMAFRMQASTPELLDLRGESRATLALYGVEPDRPSFARNCLIARRLVERGVRFVQVILGDWDHHGRIYQDLPPMCREMDQACAALIQDLKARGLLESTLVIWGGELGRSDVVQVPRKGPVRPRPPHRRLHRLDGRGRGPSRPNRGRDRRDRFQPRRAADPRPRPPGNDSPPAGSGPSQADVPLSGSRFPLDRRGRRDRRPARISNAFFILNMVDRRPHPRGEATPQGDNGTGAPVAFRAVGPGASPASPSEPRCARTDVQCVSIRLRCDSISAWCKQMPPLGAGPWRRNCPGLGMRSSIIARSTDSVTRRGRSPRRGIPRGRPGRRPPGRDRRAGGRRNCDVPRRRAGNSRGCLAAEVAVDAGRVDVESAGDVFGNLVMRIGHGVRAARVKSILRTEKRDCSVGRWSESLSSSLLFPRSST